MGDRDVNWESISKSIFLPIIILGITGFAGWTATAISEVRDESEKRVSNATDAIIKELILVRQDLQSLKVEIAKLQVEVKIKHGKESGDAD